MAWALPGTPKSSQNHIKIHPNSTKNQQKLVLGLALGTPGPPLEASWAPPGARMPKTIKKVTWWTPHRGCQRRSFSNISDTFSEYFFELFLGRPFSGTGAEKVHNLSQKWANLVPKVAKI